MQGFGVGGALSAPTIVELISHTFLSFSTKNLGLRGFLRQANLQANQFARFNPFYVWFHQLK
jgi:hypothetical protein